jgi:hypothetical protein
MAFKFGDAELDTVIRNCFRPAAARAGFELRDLQDHKRAGLIDDQIKAALLAARFVVADLTHDSSVHIGKLVLRMSMDCRSFIPASAQNGRMQKPILILITCDRFVGCRGLKVFGGRFGINHSGDIAG